MRENYKMYGDVVGFDMTFSLLRDKPIEIFGPKTKVLKEFQLGFFTGVNNYNKVVIFACVVSCKTTKNDILEILEDFIQHMKGKEPMTLITDQDSATIAAISEMDIINEIKINHLYDSWHFLRSLKLKGDGKSDAHKAIFRLMTAEDDTEYRIADKYLKDNLQDFGIEQGVIGNL